MRRSNRAGLLASSVLVGLGMSISAAVAWAPAGYAQEDEEPAVIPAPAEPAAEREAEVITVTGSRLRRDAFTSASPIQVVDGELSRDLGLIDAADLVQQTTVAQGVQFDVGRSTSAGVNPTDVPSGPGSANIALRGLSAGRTLLLVNNRRLSPAGVRGAPSAPDINLIPSVMIDRIDILLDGASSVYGSDAVAGVVNYIMRDDIDGLELDAYQSIPEIGAGRQSLFSAIFGSTTDDGYINVAAEWTKTDEVTLADMADFYPGQFEYCSDRLWTQGASGKIYNSRCGSGTIGSQLAFGAAGFVDDLNPTEQDILDGAVVGALDPLDPGFSIWVRDPSANVPGFLPDGSPVPAGWRNLAVTSTALTAHSPTADDLLIHPEQAYSFYHPRYERLSLYSSGEYDTGLYGDLTAYFEASYSKRDTLDVTLSQGALPIPADFIANPFPGQSYILFYRNDVRNETTVDQARFIGGLRGDLPFTGARDWYWDAYASYSRSDGFDRIKGLLASDRYTQFVTTALISPATGELACEPQFLEDDASGLPVLPCVAADVFDPGFLASGRFPDEDANRYFFPNRMERTRFEQVIFNAYTGGEVIDLPAGPVQALIGVEFREDEIETLVDRATSEGELADDAFADRGATGSRNLIESFAELEVPIVRDAPFAKQVSVNAAARWTEEENFGAAWTYALRGQYEVNDWLMLRATYGTSFRAPDVGEQFGSELLGFADTRGAGDPCLTPGVAVDFSDHDNNPATPEVRVYIPELDPRSQTVLDNCASGGGPFGFPGVDPTSLGVGGLGTNNVFFEGVSPLVAEGSNPNLDPETSKSWTVGFSFEQPWFDAFDFRFAATYFDIVVEDQVVELSETEVVQTCYNDPGLDDPLCGFMSRSALTGHVDFVNAQLQNIGELTSRGVDLNAEAGFEFRLPGTSEDFGINFIANATRALENNETLVTELDVELREHGFPEWRANLTGVLSWRDAALLWRTRYMSPTIEDNTDPYDEETSSFNECVREDDRFPAIPGVINSPYCLFVDKAGMYFVHDVAATYSHDTWRVRLGVNNVLNDTPPEANVPLRGVGYDLFGRTYYLNLTKAF